MAEINCPVCGTPNPEASTFCWSCSSRLRDTGNVGKPGGNKPQAEDNEEWLNKLQSQTGGLHRDALDGENVPEWLQRVRARKREESADDLDDLLPDDAPGEAEIPDWMQDLKDEAPPNPIPLVTKQEPVQQQVEPDDFIPPSTPKEIPPLQERRKFLNFRKDKEEEAARIFAEGAAAGSDDTDDWLQKISTWKPPIPEATAAALESILPIMAADSLEDDKKIDPVDQEDGMISEIKDTKTDKIDDTSGTLNGIPTFSPDESIVETFSAPKEEISSELPDWLRSLQAELPSEEQSLSQQESTQSIALKPEGILPVPVWEKLSQSIEDEKRLNALSPEEISAYPQWEELPQSDESEAQIEGFRSEENSPTEPIPHEESVKPAPHPSIEIPIRKPPSNPESVDSLDSLAEASLNAASFGTGSFNSIVKPVQPIEESSNEESMDWLTELDAMTQSKASPARPQPETLSAEPSSQKQSDGSTEGLTSSVSGKIESNVYDEKSAVVPDDSDFGELDSGEIPDWLKNIQPLEAGAPLPPSSKTALVFDEERPDEKPDDTLPFGNNQVPEWLTQIPSQVEAPQETNQESAGIAPAELPAWLSAMRPMSAVSRHTKEKEKVENSGPLAGYLGVLPGGESVTQYTRPPVYSSRLTLSENQRMSAEVFELVLAEESLITPDSPPIKKKNQWILRLILGLALGAILMIMLIGNTALLSMPALFPTETVQFHEAIQALPEGAPVLVGVEFEPGLTGELQVGGLLALDHLMQRNARLTFVSTNPSGPVIAQYLLNQVLISHPQYSPEYSSVILGYLAGNATGLQEFARRPVLADTITLDQENPWISPALMGVDGLDDYTLILLITDNPETARSWMEQVQPAAPIPPFLVISSAMASPLIRPYLDSDQVDGLMSGFLGSAVYEQITGNSGQARHFWDAYQVGLTTVIVLILSGLVLQGVAGLLSRYSNRRN